MAGQKSTEILPSLKPGVYYICACMGEYDAQCALSKKIEVLAGKVSKVILQY